MAERTCSMPGCEMSHRARGLCVTHYNQAHQSERHRKVITSCAQCGAEVRKHQAAQYANRFCSLACRDAWRADHRAAVSIDCQYCKRSFVANTTDRKYCSVLCVAESRRVAQATRPDWRTPRECRGCGCTFCPLYTPTQMDCSRRCARKVAKRARRAAEAGAHGTWTWSEFMRIAQLFDYRCAYCSCAPDRLDPDHVVPLSRGGANTPSNLLPACTPCNTDKRQLLLR